MVESSLRQQQLAHSLARLISGLALPPASLDTPANLGEEGMLELEVEADSVSEGRRARVWGVQDGSGALGWREGDDESLSMSKAVQAAAEAVGKVAKLEEESHPRALARVVVSLDSTRRPLRSAQTRSRRALAPQLLPRRRERGGSRSL
ncbi:hypothetical protein BCR35DRAFT_30904 [Leucosporidium creatinivorum]|uniref:Uncharacterized protein n=1 Tax=Leucosporidium creatinivorum TaxID=106004 RepID=A0A1Y2FVM5_9BASI|nr:hypothetical protein BCR35DRAFT_30904 [Leucosporidium creatinivorum]